MSKRIILTKKTSPSTWRVKIRRMGDERSVEEREWKEIKEEVEGLREKMKKQEAERDKDKKIWENVIKDMARDVLDMRKKVDELVEKKQDKQDDVRMLIEERIRKRKEEVEKEKLSWRKKTIVVKLGSNYGDEWKIWLEKKLGIKEEEYEVKKQGRERALVTFNDEKVQREVLKRKAEINREDIYYIDAYLTEEERRRRYKSLEKTRRIVNENRKSGVEIEAVIEDRCTWIAGRRYVWDDTKDDLKREDEEENAEA